MMTLWRKQLDYNIFIKPLTFYSYLQIFAIIMTII